MKSSRSLDLQAEMGNGFQLPHHYVMNYVIVMVMVMGIGPKFFCGNCNGNFNCKVNIFNYNYFKNYKNYD